jgi:hypothetical protein
LLFRVVININFITDVKLYFFMFQLICGTEIRNMCFSEKSFLVGYDAAVCDVSKASDCLLSQGSSVRTRIYNRYSRPTKMMLIPPSQISKTIYQVRQCHNPEKLHLRPHICKTSELVNVLIAKYKYIAANIFQWANERQFVRRQLRTVSHDTSHVHKPKVPSTQTACCSPTITSR